MRIGNNRCMGFVGRLQTSKLGSQLRDGPVLDRNSSLEFANLFAAGSCRGWSGRLGSTKLFTLSLCSLWPFATK
jgi:hypothetical protein